MSYSDKLRIARVSKGYTLEELGSLVGRSKQYMYSLEKGSIRLSYDMAVKIADALNTTTDDLFLTK